MCVVIEQQLINITIHFQTVSKMLVPFQDFRVLVLTQAERGQMVLEDKLWRYVKGYIK
jgi:hypothetical protein